MLKTFAFCGMILGCVVISLSSFMNTDARFGLVGLGIFIVSFLIVRKMDKTNKDKQ